MDEWYPLCRHRYPPRDCCFHPREGLWGTERGQESPGKLTIVHGDHMQTVQELPLVLVDPFHMDVKHGGWVDLHLVLAFQELGELHLIFLWRVDRPEPSQTETVAVRWSPHPQLHGEGRDPRLAVGLTCFTLAISRRKMSSLTKLCSFVSWLKSFT